MKIFKIMNNKTLINGSLFSLYSFLNQGISFVLLIVLAKFIAPEEYGQLSLFNTFVMFLGYFIVFSSDGYLSVSFFKSNKDDFAKDVSSLLLVLGIVSAILIIIVAIGKVWLSDLLNLPQHLLYFAVIISTFNVLVHINLNLKRLKENLKTYGLLSCGFALLNFILSLLLVIQADLNWRGRVYAQFICVVVFGIIALCAFRNNSLYTKNISLSRIRTILLWGIPLIPHLATTWVRQGCDRYIIDSFYSLAEVGLFSFALNLTSVIEMVGSSFNATNSVGIYKILSDRTIPNSHKKSLLYKTSKEMFLIYSIITILIVVGVVIFVPLLLPNYKNSLPYFMVLSGYGFFKCIYYIFCNYIFYWAKNKYLMYITFSSSVLHLILSLLITKYSLYYTASIYLIIQLLIDIILVVYSVKLIKSNLKE